VPIIEASRTKEVRPAMMKKKWGAAALAASIAVSVFAWASPPDTVQDKPAQTEREDAANVGKVVITTSGVGRRDKETVIRYRKSDFSVLSVTVNGLDIPPDRFGPFKDDLMKALEYPRLRELLDRMEAVEKSIRSLGPMNSDNGRALDELLKDLDGFLARVSPDNRKVLDPLVSKLANAAFEKNVRELLLAKSHLLPGEDVRLKIRTSRCSVNGRELPSDVSDEILRLWAKFQGEPVKAGERITYIFDPVREPEKPSLD
jgi:hypothetical protein